MARSKNRGSHFGGELAVRSYTFGDEPHEATGPKFVFHQVIEIFLKRGIVAEILSAIGSVLHDSHRWDGIFEQPAVLVLEGEVKAFQARSPQANSCDYFRKPGDVYLREMGVFVGRQIHERDPHLHV